MNSPVQKKRCESCSKKVGIFGFDCKCGKYLCNTHLYSDMHNCTYDHKSEEIERLIKQNPKLVSLKINEI
jgi:hypothetical protein